MIRFRSTSLSLIIGLLTFGVAPPWAEAAEPGAAAPAPAPSPAPATLTLDQALAMARKRNRSLAVEPTCGVAAIRFPATSSRPMNSTCSMPVIGSGQSRTSSASSLVARACAGIVTDGASHLRKSTAAISDFGSSKSIR